VNEQLSRLADAQLEVEETLASRRIGAARIPTPT
jgi:hypothetical protein